LKKINKKEKEKKKKKEKREKKKRKKKRKPRKRRKKRKRKRLSGCCCEFRERVVPVEVCKTRKSKEWKVDRDLAGRDKVLVSSGPCDSSRTRSLEWSITHTHTQKGGRKRGEGAVWTRKKKKKKRKKNTPPYYYSSYYYYYYSYSF